MRVGQVYRQKLIQTVKEEIQHQEAVFLLTFSQVSGLQMSNLRKDLKQIGARLFVTRNAMARMALKDLDYDSLVQSVARQTALVWSDSDSAEVSKILTKFTKACKGCSVRGGILQGAAIKEEDVQKLADLPSREVLLAMLLGVIQSPLTRLAGVLNGKTRELLSILKQLSEKKGGK